MDDTNEDRPAGLRSRREPPPFRPVTVTKRRALSPRMLRLSLEGPTLSDLPVPDPAASVRLLIPSPGTAELVIPVWNGNEFLLPDGERPALRTFTPLDLDRATGRLDLEIVRHHGGVVSSWAEQVEPGAQAAISGPGRGYRIGEDASHVVLIGDETALPAISQLLEALPERVTVDVHVEVVSEDAKLALPAHQGRTLTWHVTDPGASPGAHLVAVAATVAEVDQSTRIWAAGEAASMQAIRTQLFHKQGIPRDRATIRGYWKPARFPNNQ